MTREGLALVLAYFENDDVTRDDILDRGLEQGREVQGGDELPIADAIAYSALIPATMLGQMTDRPLRAVLDDLPRRELRLVPEPATVPWQQAIDLVAAIPESLLAARRASELMDAPSAPNALYSVAVSAWTELSRLTGQPAATLLRGALDAPPPSTDARLPGLRVLWSPRVSPGSSFTRAKIQHWPWPRPCPHGSGRGWPRTRRVSTAPCRRFDRLSR